MAENMMSSIDNGGGCGRNDNACRETFEDDNIAAALLHLRADLYCVSGTPLGHVDDENQMMTEEATMMIVMPARMVMMNYFLFVQLAEFYHRSGSLRHDGNDNDPLLVKQPLLPASTSTSTPAVMTMTTTTMTSICSGRNSSLFCFFQPYYGCQ